LKSNNNGKKGRVSQREKIAQMKLEKRLQVDQPLHTLLHIPHRVAIACQDQLGLACINDIIWYKRNSMPQGKNRRFNVNFEYCFLFVKNQKKNTFKIQYEPFTDQKRYKKRAYELKEARTQFRQTKLAINFY